MSICSTGPSGAWLEPESLCALHAFARPAGPQFAAAGAPAEALAPAGDPLTALAFGCAKAISPSDRIASAVRAVPPTDVGRRWRAAVGLAAMGYYAAARSELAEAQRLLGGRRTVDPDNAIALARLRVAAASFARQLGDHRTASRLDGAAEVGLAGLDPGAAVSPVRAVRIDALTGLAADALGGAGAASAVRVLRLVDAILPPTVGGSSGAEAAIGSSGVEAAIGSSGIYGAALCASDARATGPAGRELVRAEWVRAEVAMTLGDGAGAIAAAERAVTMATRGGSCRHRIKSALVLAAACTVSGRTDRARSLLGRVQSAAAEHGYLPLAWAAGMLAPAVGADGSGVAAVAAELAVRGGQPLVLGARSTSR